jgi:hypothetical protein
MSFSLNSRFFTFLSIFFFIDLVQLRWIGGLSIEVHPTHYVAIINGARIHHREVSSLWQCVRLLLPTQWVKKPPSHKLNEKVNNLW